MAGRSLPSPMISLRESDPATALNWGLIDCFLLARNDPLSHVRPDERPSEREVTGLLCRPELPRRQHAGTIGPVRRRFANGGVTVTRAGETLPE